MQFEAPHTTRNLVIGTDSAWADDADEAYAGVAGSVQKFGKEVSLPQIISVELESCHALGQNDRNLFEVVDSEAGKDAGSARCWSNLASLGSAFASTAVTPPQQPAHFW